MDGLLLHPYRSVDMSLDKIIEKINEEARQKIEQIMSDAQVQIENIKKKSIEDSDAMKEKILEQARQNAVERERRMLQLARLSGRKEILSEKQKAINSIFTSALDRLAGLDPDKSRQMLRNMLIKAVKSGNEEIVLSARDRKMIGHDWLEKVNNDLIKERGLPGKLKIAEETRDIKGGFILKDGQVEINSSFEAILKFNQNELESKLAALLFGKQ
jgi:V/A-type H+-transporting ATPase subunit E